MDTKDYCKQLIEQKRKEYDKLKKVYCPCLKEYVYFTARGFFHFRYDIFRRERSIKEQIYRLNLMPLIIPVIKKAIKIDEYRPKKIKIDRRKNKPEKNVEYWALVETAGKRQAKIKVILLRIGTGNIIYWSVMKLT